MKLINNQAYGTINSSKSDSNIGGRKAKNICYHIFMVNGIINVSLQNKSLIDMLVLDYQQCFDFI